MGCRRPADPVRSTGTGSIDHLFLSCPSPVAADLAQHANKLLAWVPVAGDIAEETAALSKLLTLPREELQMVAERHHAHVYKKHQWSRRRWPMKPTSRWSCAPATVRLMPWPNSHSQTNHGTAG